MSSIAVDTVDASWRLFSPREKRLTSRGRSRLCGRRRTRGHEALKKHDGSLRHSGRIRDRGCLPDDVEEQVELYLGHDPSLDPPFGGFVVPRRHVRLKPQYRGQGRRLRKKRMKEELRAAAAEEVQELQALDARLVRYRKLLAPHLPAYCESLRVRISDLEAQLAHAHGRKSDRLCDRLVAVQADLYAGEVALAQL